MRFALTLAVVYLALMPKAWSFMNIEAVRQVPGEGFLGRSGLQVSGQQGNTDKFTSAVNTLGVHRNDENEIFITGDYKYGTSAGVKDTNRGSVHLRFTHEHREPRSLEAFVQSEFDEFKDLNSRNLVGANLRQRLAHTEKNRLYLGVGSFYEVENFAGNPDHEGFRGNIYLSYVNQISELISGSVISYYQPRLENLSEHRIRFMGGVDIRLSDRLSLDIDVNLVHDNGLPPEVEETDIDYLVGFAISY